MVTKTPKNDKNVDTKQINDGVEEEASALRHSDGNVLNEQETTIEDDNHVETEGEISLSDDSSSDDEEEIVIKKAGARRSKLFFLQIQAPIATMESLLKTLETLGKDYRDILETECIR